MKKIPRLRRRALVTALLIIAGLAFLNTVERIRYLSERTLADYSADLLTQLPLIAEQLQREGMPSSVDSGVFSNGVVEYLTLACLHNGEMLWMSRVASEAKLAPVCSSVDIHALAASPSLIRIGDAQTMIAFAIPAEFAQGRGGILFLRDADEYQAELFDIGGRLLINALVLIGLAFLLLRWSFNWSFRPLSTLNQEVTQIIDGKRVSLSEDYPAELVGVTRSLNTMLEQAQARRARYENATKDLAHSLKTRLAAAEGLLAQSDVDLAQLKRDLCEQLAQMDAQVQYQLRRAMHGPDGLTGQTVAVGPVVAKLAGLMDKVYRHKGIVFEFDDALEARFPGSEGDLMELLGNLLENAAKYCISRVRVSASSSASAFYLRVEDDGPGVEPAMREAVFQRGVRVDQRRPGQGIGLAICAEIVASYGGTINIEESELEGARFSLCLPRPS